MKETEQILADLGINNPSDAAMVRLAGQANQMPDESAEKLVGRMNFSHPRDVKLATAIVESVRSQSPRPASNGRLLAVAIALGLVATGCGIATFMLSRTLASERELRSNEASNFARQISEMQASAAKTAINLQATTSTALKNSDAALRATADKFSQQLAEYAERIGAMSSENERLKAELAAAKKP